MKVLLITGKLASERVKEIAKKLKGVEADVLTLNFPIASLMTVDYIAENLKGMKLTDYDYIIIPGLVSGDAKKIEEVTNVKTYKGTEDYRDLQLVIDAINGGVPLSEIQPADTILKERIKLNVEEELDEIEKKAKIAFEIGNVKIPILPPPFRIFIEIDGGKDCDHILKEANRVKHYVDIIVLGFPNGHEDVEDTKRKVKILTDEGFTVGVDSASVKELIEGVKAGAEVVFNLNEENIEKLREIKDKAFVVAPLSTEKRAEITYKIYERAKNEGFEKLILDPILSPPLMGLVDSLIEYKKLSEMKLNVPMMMGVLNVTELIDADSVGINALLTAIAGELGVSNLLIMDKNKTRWSSYETREATKMISLALNQRSFPKDLGVDLLILKDKKKRHEEIEERANNEIVVNSHIEPKNMDKGFVKITVNNEIILDWYGKERIRIIGKDGLSLGRKLLELTNVNPEHALYIGYELAKAEIALLLDKNYIQDEPLFKRGYININTHNNKEKERKY